MHLLKTCFCLILLTFSLNAHAALNYYHQEIDPDILQKLIDYFPEGQEISPALLDFEVDPNIRLFQEAEIIVTYLREGAALKNSFGYFLYQDMNNDDQVEASEISKKEILFENVSSETEGGPMRTGDTVNLGKFPQGTRLGFYLVADGFRQGTKTYYSIDDLNPDGRRHLAMLADADREQIVLGIEDLPYESGDRDFNDILFSFTTNPKSALDDVIDGGNIPVASATPTPSQTPDPSTPPTSNPILEKPIAPENTSSLVRLEGGGRGCSLHPEAPTAADFIRAFHGGWLLLVLWGYLSFQWNFHQRTWRQIPRKIRASLSVVLARLKR